MGRTAAAARRDISHSLCLHAGDGAHTALDATDTVEIEVGVGSRAEWCAVVEQVDVD